MFIILFQYSPTWLFYSLSGCPMVSPSEKKVLMRQEAECKLLAQASARDPEVRLVKIRSGKGKVPSNTRYSALVVTGSRKVKTVLRFF